MKETKRREDASIDGTEEEKDGPTQTILVGAYKTHILRKFVAQLKVYIHLVIALHMAALLLADAILARAPPSSYIDLLWICLTLNGVSIVIDYVFLQDFISSPTDANLRHRHPLVAATNTALIQHWHDVLVFMLFAIIPSLFVGGTGLLTWQRLYRGLYLLEQLVIAGYLFLRAANISLQKETFTVTIT